MRGPAGHFRGEPGCNSLFLGPGHAYVYLADGLSFTLNVTSEAAGVGAGILLRALELLDVTDRMQRFRGRAGLMHLIDSSRAIRCSSEISAAAK